MINILEATYIKGEKQTVTLQADKSNTELYLEVSKGVSLSSEERVAYVAGYGTVSVNFVAE